VKAKETVFAESF